MSADDDDDDDVDSDDLSLQHIVDLLTKKYHNSKNVELQR